MEPKGNVTALDSLVKKMTNVVENSREEIFTIGENARADYKRLNEELTAIKEKVTTYIANGEQLDQRGDASSQHLLQMRQHVDGDNETEIRKMYEKTHAIETQLVMSHQEETTLSQRRVELERKLVELNETIERADGLASKLSIVLPYLHDDFKYVNDMKASAKEKQQFSAKIIKAQEDERKRISREIHDGPAQMMANILLRSEIVERAFKEQSVENAMAEIHNVRQMIRTSLYEVRRIIYDLRPMTLDDLGLVATLQKYVASTADYNNMAIDFIPEGRDKRLPQIYEVSFFRLIQESLQNAIKHAHAQYIKVRLDITDDVLTAIIQDDGVGFDPNVEKDASFGLIGMKERVEMLQGELTITSEANKGTKVYIHVPYNQAVTK